MGVGREVADAYIDVNGDLTRFRNSMNKAAIQGRKAGIEAADSFAEGWNKRSKNDVLNGWENTLNALYKNGNVDWDRLFGSFNAKGLDDAQAKISKLLSEMKEEGKLTAVREQKINDIVNQRVRLTKDQTAAIAENAAFDKRRMTMLNEAMAENLKWERDKEASLSRQSALQEKYNKSFEGMFRSSQLKGMERDFDAIASAMQRMDWSRFTKGFDDLDEAEDRVRGVVSSMNEMGRVSDSNRERITRSITDHITAEKARRAAIIQTKEEIAEAAERSKFLNSTLAKMTEAAKVKELTRDFEKLAAAMATGNWGPLAKDHKSMVEFRARVQEVANEMRKVGRVSEEEFRGINSTLHDITANQKKFGVELDSTSRKFRPIQFAMDKMSTSWSRMDSTVRLVLTTIAAGAGPVSTLASGLAGAGTALVSSLGMAAGAIVPIVTGLVGVGVAAGLAVKSIDGIQEAFPRIQTSIDRMSQSWSDSAAAFGREWGPALDNFMDRLATVVFTSNAWGAAMGEATARVTDAFTRVLDSPGMDGLMTAMQEILPDAVAGLGTGFAGVFGTLINMMSASAPIAKLLGEDFARWGQNLADATEKARASGAMTEAFAKMRESLLAVLDLAGSLGNMFGTIFGLGADSGNRMLGTLTDLVDKFTAWMQTEDGRAAMLEWFANAERIMGSLKEPIAAIAQGFASLVDAQSIAQLENLMSLFGQLTPVLFELLDVISELGIFNILAESAASVGGAIAPLLPALHDLAGALGPTLQGAIQAVSPTLAALGTAIAPVIQFVADLVAQVGPPLVDALGRISAAMTPIIEVIGELGGAFLRVIGPIIGDLVIGIINNVVGVWEGLSDVIMGVVNTVKAVFEGDWAAAWEGLQQIVSGAVQAVWNLIQLWIVGKIGAILKGFMGPIIGIFSKGWKSLGDGVKAGVQPIVDFFTKHFPAAVAGLGAAIGKVPGLFSTAFTAVKLFVITAITSIVLAITTGIGTAVTWLQENLGMIGQFFSDTWTTIVESVTNFGIMFWESLTAIFSTVTEWFSGLFTGAGESMTTPLSDASTRIQEIWVGVQEFFTTFIEGFKELWAGLGEFFGTLWTGITEVFSNAFVIIGEVVTNAFTFLSEGFTLFFEGLGVLAQAGWDIIVAIFTAVWETIKTLLAVAILTIEALFTGNFEMLGTIFSAGWERLKMVWSTALETISTILSTVWTNITTFTSTAWENFKTIISNAWDAVKTFTSQAVENVKTFVSQAWENIKTFTSTAWTNIKQAITDAWNGIKSFTSDAVNNVKQFVSQAWENIKSATSQAWSNIKQAISDAWNNIKSAVQTGVDNAKQAIQNGWNNAKQATTDAWNNIKQGVSDGVNNMKQAVQTGLDNVVSFFRELPGRMSSAISGAVGEMRTIGSNIISGLTEGIQSMAQNAINAVGDVVNGAIGWAKSLLGIASPSKVFRQFGRFTGEGFADGMERTANVVKDAAQAMADTATAPFAVSRMTAAGMDAAKGLADGLKKNKGAVDGVLTGFSYSGAALTADRITPIGESRNSEGRGNSRSLVVEAGAIQVQSNASDGAIVAEQVIDEFANFSQM